MRNLKKILALVLALIMSMSLVVTANAFADQEDIDATYEESIDVLSNLGVFKGYEDETFKPTKSIKRAEVAAIIYRIVTGDVKDTQAPLYVEAAKFNDVKATYWGAGYIGYCYNAGYIKGYPDGSFKPEKTVTGYEALAMILRAVGYGVNGEFTGAGWDFNTASLGNQLKITKNIKPGLLKAAASREVVAEILFQAILVPQVEYTTAFGYQSVELAGILTKGAVSKVSLGAQTFGLDCTEGEITAVGYHAGTTTLTPYDVDHDNKLAATKYDVVVANTEANWEDIGYAAYVYTVPGAKKTLNAVSDVTIIGSSLGESTNGTKYADLVDPNKGSYIASEDNKAEEIRFYYNGEECDTKAKLDKALAASQIRGAKVDLIDNDNGGLVEVVAVTEYEVATVKGIATDINAGSNAVQKNSYYLNNKAVKVDHLVCADELAMYDLVTYVDYKCDTYVTVAPSTIGDFTRINYNVVGAPEGKSYVIGGEEYTLATKNVGDKTLLNTTNAKDQMSMIVYTDPYGYMLKVEENKAAKDYLFTVATDHSSAVTGLTFAKLAFADGSVIDEYVTNWANNTLNVEAKHIYSYAADTTSNFKLTRTGVDFDGGDLNVKKGTAVLRNAGTIVSENLRINNKTIMVDLRDVMDGKATEGTVYTGYAEIPAISGAQGSYLTGDNSIISLLFLTEGTNVADLSAEFIVYTTGYNYYEDGNYYLNVLQDGVKVENYALSSARYDLVKDLGTGIYKFAPDGGFTFTAFNEVWKDVTWGDGIIFTDDDLWTDAEDVTFTVVDITNADPTCYDHIVGNDGDKDAIVKAYIKTNNKGEAAHIYVIVGTPADVESTTNVAKLFVKQPVTEDGLTGKYVYHVEGKKITMAGFVADSTERTITVIGATGDKTTANKGDKNVDVVLTVEAGYTITNVEVEGAEFEYEVTTQTVTLAEISDNVVITVITDNTVDFTITKRLSAGVFDVEDLPATANVGDEISFTVTAVAAGAEANKYSVIVEDEAGNVIANVKLTGGVDAAEAVYEKIETIKDTDSLRQWWQLNNGNLYKKVVDGENVTYVQVRENGDFGSAVEYFKMTKEAVEAVAATAVVEFTMPATNVVVR